MSDSNALSATDIARQEAKAQRDRFIAEQKALGLVHVTGWVPKAAAADVRKILEAIQAGQTEYLPAEVMAREDRIQALQAGDVELERTRQTLELAQQEVERRQLELTRTRQELAQYRQDANALRSEADQAVEALADETRKRELIETQLADAMAELGQARQAGQALNRPGIRASLARALLG